MTTIMHNSLHLSFLYSYESYVLCSLSILQLIATWFIIQMVNSTDCHMVYYSEG